MAFHQHLVTCPTHDGCGVIMCVTDADIDDGDGGIVHRAGSVVWVSHGDADDDHDARANPDHPWHGAADDATGAQLLDAARRAGLIAP